MKIEEIMAVPSQLVRITLICEVITPQRVLREVVDFLGVVAVVVITSRRPLRSPDTRHRTSSSP